MTLPRSSAVVIECLRDGTRHQLPLRGCKVCCADCGGTRRAGGRSLNEWSVLPVTREVARRQVVAPSALTSPPGAATRVRLTFTNGRPRLKTPLAAAAPAGR
jgi:hypothetical protein